MGRANIISRKSAKPVSREFVPMYFYLKVMEELNQEKRTRAA